MHILTSILFLIPLVLPLVCGAALLVTRRQTGALGKGAVLLPPLAMAVCAACLHFFFPDAQTVTLLRLGEGVAFTLKGDALGFFFALLMGAVWFFAALYALSQMGHEEGTCAFLAFFAMAPAALWGLCCGGTMVTYYLFLEMLTLLSVPLVVHGGRGEAVAAGLKFLIYSVLGAGLALLGMVMLRPALGGYELQGMGRLLDGAMPVGMGLAMGLLMILGFGAKAGLYPLHGWLPTAHPVAPSPASAVLSGVLTKAGVLGMIRTVYCFIGADALRGTWVQTAAVALSLLTILMGSVLAYGEKNMKRRLAYSTVSQVSYLVLGIMTLTPAGLAGSLIQAVVHSTAKTVLFLSAGKVLHHQHVKEVSGYRGMGKIYPITMGCFTLASVALVGLPPLAGFTGKWFLAQGALASGLAPWLQVTAIVVLLVSALLTAGYLFPPAAAAFFPGDDVHREQEERFSLVLDKTHGGETWAIVLVTLMLLIFSVYTLTVSDPLLALTAGLM